MKQLLPGFSLLHTHTNIFEPGAADLLILSGAPASPLPKNPTISPPLSQQQQLSSASLLSSPPPAAYVNIKLTKTSSSSAFLFVVTIIHEPDSQNT